MSRRLAVRAAWFAAIVVVTLVAALRIVATWNVRNGAADVAEDVLEARSPAGLELTWSCNEYVATAPLSTAEADDFLDLLGHDLMALGFERVTHRHYQRGRVDSLDFDVVTVDPVLPEADHATIRMSVFDTDSSVCLPAILARDVGVPATDALD